MSTHRGNRHIRESISSRTRFAIFHRDGFRCCYCGRHAGQSELVVDHVIPVASGGSSHISNLRTACASCNAGKSNAFEIEEIPGGNYPYSDYAKRIIGNVEAAHRYYVSSELDDDLESVHLEMTANAEDWEAFNR